MSKAQWQSNDSMSVVDTSTNKVFMGTKNVKPAGDLREGPFKGDRSWVSFLRVEHSGSNIDVLSPVEALEIKYGQRIQDQLATTYRNNSGGVLWTGWRIVYERVMNSHSTIVKRYLENQEFRRKLVAKYRDFAGSKKDMLVKTSVPPFKTRTPPCSSPLICYLIEILFAVKRHSSHKKSKSSS